MNSGILVSPYSRDNMKVPVRKVDDAYDRWFSAWIEVHQGISSSTSGEIYDAFWKFLRTGGPGRSFDGEWYFYMSRQSVDLVDTLLGPHYKTVMKIWLIRNQSCPPT
jgi:hypothetical protein